MAVLAARTGVLCRKLLLPAPAGRTQRTRQQDVATTTATRPVPLPPPEHRERG